MKEEVIVSITSMDDDYRLAAASEVHSSQSSKQLSSTVVICFTVVSALMTIYILANVISTCRKYKAVARSSAAATDNNSILLARR